MPRSLRLNPQDQETLEALAEQTQRPIGALLSEAIRELKRKLVIEATDRGYHALQQDASVWEDEEAEREAWDAAAAADLYAYDAWD